ncbi:MAG TPA: hypothetical protein VGH89_41175, partial [Pseudonocardia sp.]
MSPRLASLGLLIGLGLLTGCSSSGANTSCDLGGCTITFNRSGSASASVLGIEAKLVGVQDGQATVSIAGQNVMIPVGGQSQSDGFNVRLERVTDT